MANPVITCLKNCWACCQSKTTVESAEPNFGNEDLNFSNPRSISQEEKPPLPRSTARDFQPFCIVPQGRSASDPSPTSSHPSSPGFQGARTQSAPSHPPRSHPLGLEQLPSMDSTIFNPTLRRSPAKLFPMPFVRTERATSSPLERNRNSSPQILRSRSSGTPTKDPLDVRTQTAALQSLPKKKPAP